MGYPVVHFEINTKTPHELREFYASAFDWKIGVSDGDGYDSSGNGDAGVRPKKVQTNAPATI